MFLSFLPRCGARFSLSAPAPANAWPPARTRVAATGNPAADTVLRMLRPRMLRPRMLRPPYTRLRASAVARTEPEVNTTPRSRVRDTYVPFMGFLCGLEFVALFHFAPWDPGSSTSAASAPPPPADDATGPAGRSRVPRAAAGPRSRPGPSQASASLRIRSLYSAVNRRRFGRDTTSGSGTFSPHLDDRRSTMEDPPLRGVSLRSPPLRSSSPVAVP
jgi:hypothetical protein